MGSGLCKYRYNDDRCAHGMIVSNIYVGEDICSHADAGRRFHYQENCAMEYWYGLYCPKYHSFYCDGRKHCILAERYFGSLVKVRLEVC